MRRQSPSRPPGPPKRRPPVGVGVRMFGIVFCPLSYVGVDLLVLRVVDEGLSTPTLTLTLS